MEQGDTDARALWGAGGAPQTLGAALARRAAEHGSARACCWLERGETPVGAASYAELHAAAQRVAADLAGTHAPGTPIGLLYPNEPDFVTAFWGCQLAGLTAVPLAMPRGARGMEGLAALVRAAGAPLVLTSSALRGVIARLGAAPQAEGIGWRFSDEIGVDPAHFATPEAAADAVAILQFTSGSTGRPKGVMVTHANLLANCAILARICGTGRDLHMLNWLPFFHDWGLVGNLVFPILAGGQVTYMDPSDFLRRPLRWIEQVAATRATVSCAPDFAYDAAAQAAEADPGRRRLDLSGWRIAMMGAEPVRPATARRFAEAFAPDGFSETALYPTYGLAEATLIVTGGAPGAAPVFRTLDRAALEQGRALDAEPGEASRTITGVGTGLGAGEVRVVDPDTGRTCRPDRVGEVWVRGPSVAAGYLGRAEDTAETFAASPDGEEGGARAFLRTGDLGLLSPDGELFICGRLKDVVIKAGANHFAEDLEASAMRAHAGLRPHCGAAFGIEADGAERLVLVHELGYGPKPPFKDVVGAIQRTLSIEQGIFADAVCLLAPGTLEKTSSGKIRRRATRASYLACDLAPLHSWKGW